MMNKIKEQIGLSSCVEKISCPKCGSKSLQVFQNDDGSHTGYCFGQKQDGSFCRSFFKDPYAGTPPERAKQPRRERSAEDVAADLAYVKALPGASLPHRKLQPWALAHYGVKMEVSEEDGITPTIGFFPFTRDRNITAYKSKHYDPKFIWIMGDFKDVNMFGWEQAVVSGSSRIWVTEGEEDAVALYQALKDDSKGTAYADREPAVVSLSSGASSVKRDFTRVLSDLKSFKQVVLVFDQDDPGRQAVKDALSILPTAQTVSIPGKDANECIMSGRTKALVSAALFKGAIPKNTRIINASSLYEAACEPASWGLSWPWQGITDLTRGIRFGETIYIGAGVKMGKSEVVNTIGKHLAVDHDIPILMAKPEEANKKTIKMVLGKVAGKIFHDPKVEFDYEAYREAAKKLGNKLNLINLYQHLGWDSLKDDIRAGAAEGCKAVFIDPITNLVNGESAGETDSHLKEISQELSAMMMDLNMVAFIFCHLKAPNGGAPHERGGEIFSNQFAGSRGMMRSCNYMMGLWGNKDPMLQPEERNRRKFIILEDREFGEVGSVDLYWDYNTGLFNEIKGEADGN